MTMSYKRKSGRRVDPKGRSTGGSQHIRLYLFEMQTAAFRSLSVGARALLLELKALYNGKGISGDQRVIAYCRIGERSSHTWFVLTHLLGFGHVRNYDGSWTEWGNSVRVPIETGGPTGPTPWRRAGGPTS
jgi:rhodanese-related sulfurtransferase